MHLKTCVAVILVVMGFCMSAAADDVQNANVAKGGIAVNANNGAQVYLDASKKIYQLNDKEDLKRIIVLEAERINLLTEISRLSLAGEDQIIKRSQQELINSLPADLKEKYLSGDWRSVVEYLELSKKGLEKKAEKVSQALSKTEFELAFLYADAEPTVALEHLNEALKLNPQNLPAAALKIQLLIGVGRLEGIIDLLGALSNRSWFSSAGKDSVEEVEQLILGSYIRSVMALIDSGRSDLVVETIRRGLEFSDSAVGLSSRGRSDLRHTLEFYSKLLDGKTRLNAELDGT